MTGRREHGDRPVYVGESGDVRVRIRSHADKFWFKRPIVQNASYLPIKNPTL